MHKLIVRHVEGLDPARFVVQRVADLKAGEPVEVRSPVTWPVEGQPGGLSSELRWYLESFLDYPFDPLTERAVRVKAGIRAWGRAAFKALFNTGRARDFYRDAVREGAENLHVQVRSDDPRVLAWPWEALDDGEAAPLALTGRFDRSLNNVADPTPLPAELPRDRVNILLVIARPYDEDVGYRSIAWELVDLVEKRNLPAHVTVLRPPTLARLQAVLEEHPNTFHLLHFDGHGGYGETAGSIGADRHRLQAVQGRLVFETEDGTPDPIDAGLLADLMRVHRLPTVVLSACRSAMLDERAEDPFASVAAALLKSGVRSVVAMAWSLFVSGAREFLPAFYETLFRVGDVGQAMRAGRRKMREQPKRVCARGHFPLSDWLVPVIYQQTPFDFSFATTAPPSKKRAALPVEASDEENPYGLVGRNRALLVLERAMHRKPVGLLIHGISGVGKTTLVRGFLHWLALTGGLGLGSFWFSFNDIRSADHVVNHMVQALFGTNMLTAPMELRCDALVRTLKEHPFVIVWDNFESARGIEGTSERGLLPPEDLVWLRHLLARLRGGRTKVLISSRSDEAWLGMENRFRIDLGGLDGEERWVFCQAILDDLGRKAELGNPELAALVDSLEGHPLMMRMVLPRLEEMSVAQIVAAVRGNLVMLGEEGNALHDKMMASLMFVEQGLPQELRPLCAPLGLHEGFILADDLTTMAASVGGDWGAERIERFLKMLAVAGLVRRGPVGVNSLHPALTGFLRGRAGNGDSAPWQRAFVNQMTAIAKGMSSLSFRHRRLLARIHHANFHQALQIAESLDIEASVQKLLQSLADCAEDNRNFSEAERLLRMLAEQVRGRNLEREAAVYHQLGALAQEQRKFDTAEKWLFKALAISEELDIEDITAAAFDKLGLIAQKRQEFDAAANWHLKSLALAEKRRDQRSIAISYHQLGSIADERQNFNAAQDWYHKSLFISERFGYKGVAATTCHQLGMVSLRRWRFVSADNHHLDTAERWYLKSLSLNDGDELHKAHVYHELGSVAVGRLDLDAAERWYHKALEIAERQFDVHGAAQSYGQVALIASMRNEYETSAGWLIRCANAMRRTYDDAGLAQTASNFLLNESAAPIEVRPRLRAKWINAGLPPLVDSHER